MKLRVSNQEIIQIIKFMDSISKKEYPFKIVRSISRTSKTLKEIYGVYETVFSKIGDKYFEKDENGYYKRDDQKGFCLKNKSDVIKASKEISDLLEETTEVEFESFSETEIEKINVITKEEYEFFEKYFIEKE